MIKRILVVTDGSPSALSAVSIAASLAGIIKIELIGIFVEDTSRLTTISTLQAVGHALTGEPLVPQPRSPEALAREEQRFSDEEHDLERFFNERCAAAQVQGRFIAVRGEPDAVLREWAKTVDFVVLGNRGPAAPGSGGASILSLLRTVARPILVVPDEVAGESRMLVAYDGSLTADRALRSAAEFAEIADFESIHLLTIAASLDEASAVQAPAVQYLSAYSMAVTSVVKVGKPDQVIAAYVAEIDASVLAIGAFGSNRIKETIFGSTTEAVLRDAQTAVLLVS